MIRRAVVAIAAFFVSACSIIAAPERDDGPLEVEVYHYLGDEQLDVTDHCVVNSNAREVLAGIEGRYRLHLYDIRQRLLRIISRTHGNNQCSSDPMMVESRNAIYEITAQCESDVVIVAFIGGMDNCEILQMALDYREKGLRMPPNSASP